MAEPLRAVRVAGASPAGPLQALLDDPEVSDVLVNGAAGVWVDRGGGTERVALDLGGPTAVRALAVRLVAAGGRRLDDASPVADARLPDGTRVHVVLPPLAPEGPLISLRTVRREAFTLAELVAAGTVPAELVPVLEGMVRNRVSFLVTGATGSGKTTLLSALLSLVGPDERLVCVEEAVELTPRHPHVVRLLSRPPNVEGVGEVTLAQLVRQALRMRPDRLVLGECRGAEVRDVLTALNTGHAGGATTLHANGPADVPARLEALGSAAGLDRTAVRAQAASAFGVVVHVRRGRPGRAHGATDPDRVGAAGRAGSVRHVAEVAVLDRSSDGLVVRTAVSAAPDVDGRCRARAGPAWPDLLRRTGVAGVPTVLTGPPVPTGATGPTLPGGEVG